MDSAYVLDSYAMIAHFEDEAGGEKVRKVLKAAHAGKTKLYMSVINFGEIYIIRIGSVGGKKRMRPSL